MNYSESDNNQIKIIAFHLPQYHTFPENDEWWGKGFTEWVNVRKAKPLFEGHNQPRVPLNNDYYNMLDISTLERQAEQSKKYGIYGFCYYHYWFNGKKLLEKPVELLLEHNEINQRFCLCWANEPWTRSWDGDTGVVLMPQEYGGKDEWEEHFECGFWIGRYSNTSHYDQSNLKIYNCRIRNNFADGINFCQGTHDSAAYNNDSRNNGDDGLAMWNATDFQPDDEYNNVFAYNTVEFIWRAGGIAVYGGEGHKIYNNYIRDTFMAAGIHLNDIFAGNKQYLLRDQEGFI